LKIAILGGTGHFGKALALRWAKNHEVVIGSREEVKAAQIAQALNEELRKVSILKPIGGLANLEALGKADIVVLALRFNPLLSFLQGWKDHFASKIVISPVVPLAKKDFFRYLTPPEGSAALAIRRLLPDSCQVISALHTVPAAELQDLGKKVEGDVIVCGEAGEAKETVKKLVGEIEDLRVLDGGPLEVSSMVESMVPLILNLKHFGLHRDLTIKFI
jgi:8-hydroxy-5-deazaflavin:NADPH oxidoreductase